jgi:hypothetical protein
MSTRFVSREEAEEVFSGKVRGKRMTLFPRGQLIVEGHFRRDNPFDTPGQLNVHWVLRSNLSNEEAEDWSRLGIEVEELRAWCAEAYRLEPEDIELWCDESAV